MRRATHVSRTPVAPLAGAAPVARFATRGAAFAVAAASVLLFACDRPPSADGMREWSAADHDRAEEQSAGAGAGQAAPQPQRGEKRDGGESALIEVAWAQNCAICHGPVGHGDGPNGPMVKAPDLTREDWQGKIGDDDIAATIRTGKGKMPKFDLPDPVVRGLVARIRAVRGR